MAHRLSGIVSPAFVDAHRGLRRGEFSQLVLKGGRGSAKSSFASIEGILLLVKHPDIHGVVMRKVSNTLRSTVYAQYRWAVDALGLGGRFKCTVSPMELTYLPTGQKMLFFGADDPGKLKSIKVPFGYIGYLHLEELDQFAGEEEVRSIEQSVLRGGPLAFEIKSFNPPRTRDNWANRYVLRDKPGQLIHHSTYHTTPAAWLGQRFLDDAAFLRQTDPDGYRHEYGGEPVASGGAIFDNVVGEAVPDELIATFDRVRSGVDWGWYPDPWAFVRVHYAAGQRTLYVFDEAGGHKLSNRETAELVKAHGVGPNDPLVCDCAEPKSIEDYREAGLAAMPAEKGPGSVEYSYKWLQSLRRIVIDPARCPGALREFTEGEYLRGRDGEIVSGFPDRDNHFIDAVRYATGEWMVGARGGAYRRI